MDDIKSGMQDPETLRIIRAPGMEQIIMESVQNPSALQGYTRDPKIREAFTKPHAAGSSGKASMAGWSREQPGPRHPCLDPPGGTSVSTRPEAWRAPERGTAISEAARRRSRAVCGTLVAEAGGRPARADPWRELPLHNPATRHAPAGQRATGPTTPPASPASPARPSRPAQPASPARLARSAGSAASSDCSARACPSTSRASPSSF